ncbi:hypothetical protein PS870_04472 [Pseudomonas fluorescens]|uniref:O-antigen ligase domain-containing protein n=1 Tax=Pseudomonas fluorescens TaxID=294 RepID=A0A5E7NA50_PSEFL|nr:hypothetical protein [Pseudomonas fluorescens]VVP34061.1 hypothetical protein PS870_04472 [Pseudomonas fluorescens]
MTALKGSTAYAFFLAAFPGYFFYHVLKSTIHIPYIGWFSAILILCAVTWGVRSLITLVTASYISITPKVTAPFWVMILFMLATIATNTFTDEADYITADGSLALVMVAIWMIALFQIGRHINVKSTSSFTIAAGLITAGFALCAALFFNPNAGVMYMPLLAGDEHEAANYQGMARSVMCTAIVLFPFIKANWYRILLMSITAATLYLIGSRTELALFLLTIPAFVFIHYRQEGFKLALIAVVVAAAAMMISGFDIVGWISAYTSSDASLNERSILLESGLAGIESSPLLGDYLGQIREFGSIGFYIHNALSMWQQFGLLGFALYIYLIVVSALIGWSCYRRGVITPQTEVLIYLSLISLVGVLTTKSIFWPVPALAWGLAARALSAPATARPKHLSKGLTTSP